LVATSQTSVRAVIHREKKRQSFDVVRHGQHGQQALIPDVFGVFLMVHAASHL
jgi:hypothetical protein